MAFTFTVDLEKPIPTEIVRSKGDHVAVAHVGVDDTYPLTYSVIVGISVGAGCDEFFFKLLEVDAENSDVREYWDDQPIGDHITDDDRELILKVVRRVTKLLMETERPDSFYCCTHGDNLPPETLEKYESINEVFTQCGYEVTLTNSDRGRYSWWVERL